MKKCVSVLESHGVDDDLPKVKASNERCLLKNPARYNGKKVSNAPVCCIMLKKKRLMALMLLSCFVIHVPH